MKNCKFCNEEMKKGLKFCPKCGKKQKKIPVWVIVIICIVVIGAIASSGDSESPDTTNNTSNNTSSSTKQTESLYNIGDIITTKKYEITVISVKELDSVGSEYFKTQPAEGAIFVAVDFKYKNITDKPIGMFNFPSTKLVDSSNVKYSNDINASSYYATETDPNRKVLSDLNPGITVTDSDVFEISTDSYNTGSWKLLIDADKDVYVKIK